MRIRCSDPGPQRVQNAARTDAGAAIAAMVLADRRRLGHRVQGTAAGSRTRLVPFTMDTWRPAPGSTRTTRFQTDTRRRNLRWLRSGEGGNGWPWWAPSGKLSASLSWVDCSCALRNATMRVITDCTCTDLLPLSFSSSANIVAGRRSRSARILVFLQYGLGHPLSQCEP